MKVGFLAFLLCSLLVFLTGLVSCTTKNKANKPPDCVHGVDESGECKTGWSGSTGVGMCVGDYGIKLAGAGCIFFTSAQANGCQVRGLTPRKKTQSDACYVEVNSTGARCDFDDLDVGSRMCRNPITADKADVYVYLKTDKTGLIPRVIFKEQVKEGAVLALRPYEYGETDIETSTSQEDGKQITQLSVPLMIPWQVEYIKADGSKACAEGVLTGSHTSPTSAVQGTVCP